MKQGNPNRRMGIGMAGLLAMTAGMSAQGHVRKVAH